MSFRLYRDRQAGPEQTRDLQHQPRKAAQLILASAAQGDRDAQALLGQILLDGRGIQKDPALALKWFRIASPQHAMAANMAGRCLEHGWGCEPDPAAAAAYYRQAADRQLDWGLYNLANLLATGRGVAHDLPQALQLYRQAAERGHAKSMNLYGRMLEEGSGCTADPAQARHWYRRSAEAGDFRGQFSHAGILLAQGRTDEARHWFLKALAAGHLKFVRQAAHQLQQLADPALNDISAAYQQRARVLDYRPPAYY